MRLAASWLVVVGLAGGCDNGKMHTRPEAGPDAPEVDRWWKPAPGEARNWDIQLRPPFDLSADRAMVDVDLWALVPAATMLDYGDGDPVMVPAGGLAGTIAELRGRASPPIIICRFTAGAVRLSDPDARKFPGFEAAPPERPDPPAAGSAIGWSTFDPQAPDERFLDIRAQSRAAWSAVMWKRFDLAAEIGCDGIDPDKSHVAMSDPGWTMEAAEQTSWLEELADQAHQRELSIGMRNGHTLPGQVDALADDFDWMMVERCGEFQDCDLVRPFINLQRAVFAIDYQTNVDGDSQLEAVVCSRQQGAMITDGLVKDDALSSAFRAPCVP